MAVAVDEIDDGGQRGGLAGTHSTGHQDDAVGKAGQRFHVLRGKVDFLHGEHAAVDDAVADIIAEALGNDGGTEAAQVVLVGKVNVADFLEAVPLLLPQEAVHQGKGVILGERRGALPHGLQGTETAPRRRVAGRQVNIRTLGINTLLQEIIHMQGEENQQRAFGLGIDIGMVLAAGTFGNEIHRALLGQLGTLLRGGAAVYQLCRILSGEHPGGFSHGSISTGLHPVRLKPRPQIHGGAVNSLAQLQVLANVVIDVSRIAHVGCRSVYHFPLAMASKKLA